MKRVNYFVNDIEVIPVHRTFDLTTLTDLDSYKNRWELNDVFDMEIKKDVEENPDSYIYITVDYPSIVNFDGDLLPIPLKYHYEGLTGEELDEILEKTRLNGQVYGISIEIWGNSVELKFTFLPNEEIFNEILEQYDPELSHTEEFWDNIKDDLIDGIVV